MHQALSAQSKPFEVGAATLMASARPGVLEVRWTGRSSEGHADRSLRVYFSACVQRARATECALELRIEQLEFANSASIAALIHLIGLAHSQNIRLTIAYNSATRWQAVSVRALRWAATDPRTTFIDV